MDMAATDWQAGLMPGTTSQVDPSISGAAGSSGVAFGLGSGQHGYSLADDGSSPDTGNPFLDFWNWLNAPIKAPMSPVGIAKIVFVVALAIIVWSFVLYHIRIAAEAI